jgi:uncharacterized protein YndB with AHSA1/START domain
MANTTSSPTTGEALVITREFDAPRELVWKAWSDPQMLQKWWGPKDFTAPSVQIDFRVGGKWLASMSSPNFMDGRELWSTGTYREIVPMDRIVTTDSFADENGHIVPSSHYDMEGLPLEMLVTVTFEDVGGKTRMTLRHEGFPAGEHREGATEGWSESLDKLETALKE